MTPQFVPIVWLTSFEEHFFQLTSSIFRRRNRMTDGTRVFIDLVVVSALQYET